MNLASVLPLLRQPVEKPSKKKPHRCPVCGKTDYRGCTRKNCPYRGKK